MRATRCSAYALRSSSAGAGRWLKFVNKDHRLWIAQECVFTTLSNLALVAYEFRLQGARWVLGANERKAKYKHGATHKRHLYFRVAALV